MHKTERPVADGWPCVIEREPGVLSLERTVFVERSVRESATEALLEFVVIQRSTQKDCWSEPELAMREWSATANGQWRGEPRTALHPHELPALRQALAAFERVIALPPLSLAQGRGPVSAA